MDLLPTLCLSYINGQYISPSTAAKRHENLFPATNQPINHIVYATQDDLQHAMETSQAAFKTWSMLSVETRSKILLSAAAKLREQLNNLAILEVWDTGKPISESLAVDVNSAADTLEYFAKVALALEDKVIPNQGALIYTSREPLGVCVGIGAWNYPLQIACWKAAPALMMGNTMVFKPSELTPMTALKLAEIFTQSGMPAGVFNVVLGDGEIAQELLSSSGVAKISFTGSVTTGKKIAESAAKKLLPVTLELGGKSPLLVFDDADIDQAVYGAMLANFYTQGEICSNGTRVYVADKIKDKFLDKLVSRTNKLTIGNPFDAQIQLGSLISRAHLNKVKSYVDHGKSSGADLLAGGYVVEEDPLDKGNFIAPTIFANCKDTMSIVQDEIFGPVMSVLSFTDEDEVLQQANNTLFGLAAGVFTNDIKRGHRIARKLQAGICWINNYNITPLGMPFGGYKQSGLGRENCIETLSHYTQLKSVYVELNQIDHPYS